MTLFPQTVKQIKERSDKNILFLGGGIIPQKDITKLKSAGMAEVFGPGTPIDEVSKFIKANLNQRLSKQNLERQSKKWESKSTT